MNIQVSAQGSKRGWDSNRGGVSGSGLGSRGGGGVVLNRLCFLKVKKHEKQNSS